MVISLNKAFRRLQIWPLVFLAPFFLFYLAFNLYPIVYSFYISMTNWSGLNMKEMNFVGLKNYVDIFTKDVLFWRSLGNTLKLMLLAMPLTVLSGLLMAQILFTIRRGRRVFQTLSFLPYITTPVAIGMIFSFILNYNVGTLNAALRALGLIEENINWLGSARYAPISVAMLNIWKNFGFFMAFYLAGMSSIPDDLYEAAKIDGAGPVQSFFRITLPMLKPINLFVLVSSINGGLQLFDEAILLFSSTSSAGRIVGGPERSVLTVLWYFYDTSFQNTSRYGYGAAVAFTLFLIIGMISLYNMKMLGKEENEHA